MRINMPEEGVDRFSIVLRDDSEKYDELAARIQERFNLAYFGLHAMPAVEVRESFMVLADSYKSNVIPVYTEARYDYDDSAQRPILATPSRQLSEFWDDFSRSMHMSFPFQDEQARFLARSLRMPALFYIGLREDSKEHAIICKEFNRILAPIGMPLLIKSRR